MSEANCAAAVQFVCTPPCPYFCSSLFTKYPYFHSQRPRHIRKRHHVLLAHQHSSTLHSPLVAKLVHTHNHQTNPHPACQSGPSNPSKPLRPFLSHKSPHTLALVSDTLCAQILPSHTKHPAAHLRRKRYMQRTVQVLNYAIYGRCVRDHRVLLGMFGKAVLSNVPFHARWDKTRSMYISVDLFAGY
jgi:hypothetical protein